MHSAPPPPTGRLAPSPTGLLHLGNAWAFLLAWLGARAAGGRVVLRMEDIDPDRSRPEFAAAILEDLRWLGLDYDGEVMVQSQRSEAYASALRFLEAQGLAYPCYCTRKELRLLAGAPHVDDAGAPYPGTCRNLSPEDRRQKEAAGRRPALRLHCPEGDFAFTDRVYGPQSFRLAQCGGDFALRRSDHVVAYQLAVVVDDAAMGVTQVVRGSDILISTPRQMALCRMLGLAVPDYAHVPLLLDEEGQRLAKRHQSLSLHALRSAGVASTAVIGLLACLAGLREGMTPLHPQELLPGFSLEQLSPLTRQEIRLTPAHIAAVMP